MIMVVLVAVHGHVLTGLQTIVIIIGHSTATALIHPLEKSRTLAVTHVAIVKVSNVFHDSKTTTYYDNNFIGYIIMFCLYVIF